VHVSGSTVRRVLGEEGLVIEGAPPREPVPRSPWPDWLTWKPNSIWAYDFTHWTRARRASIAILDVVSRKWLATLTSPEETSVEVEVAFTAALDAEHLLELADERATTALREAIASGEKDQVHGLAGGGQVPLLLAISENGPQMRSVSTREFMAGVAIAQQFGRPHTPQDQAWIETLFGHVKGEWPHLEKIRDPGELYPQSGRPSSARRWHIIASSQHKASLTEWSLSTEMLSSVSAGEPRGHGVKSAVDVEHFAGDGARQVR
jgi:putative transposase